MSLYSTSVSTATIDPVFHSSRRCTFSLGLTDQAYLPNLRLGNLGVQANTTTEYALGCGVAGSIARITLLDGEEEIDSLRQVNSWLTFRSFFRPNADAAYIKQPLEGGSGRGFTSSTSMETVVPLPFRKYATNAAGLVNNQHIHTGTLDLREVFPILGSMTHLSTAIFKNLRIVIEYETDQARMLVQDNRAASPLVPILMADEITDQALIQTLDKQLMSSPVFWDAVEMDQIGVKAISDTDNDGSTVALRAENTQIVALQSAGFLGKYVKRMMIKKSPQNKALNVVGTNVQGFGANGSLSMNKEQINLRVNGRSLLGGRGYTTPAQMAMGTSDVWGEINAPAYGAVQSVGLDAARDDAENAPAGVAPTEPSILTVGTAPRHAATTGQQSYCSFNMESRVDNLIIEYQRTGRFQAPNIIGQGGTGVAIDLTCFAEVSKSLTVMGGGKWRIQYV